MNDRPVINPDLVWRACTKPERLKKWFTPKPWETGSGTRYTAIAMHTNIEGDKQHEEMGFLNGWGIALDQLVAFVKAWQ